MGVGDDRRVAWTGAPRGATQVHEIGRDRVGLLGERVCPGHAREPPRIEQLGHDTGLPVRERGRPRGRTDPPQDIRG